jgi:PPP family 3-phenylpropionic acid transporter
MKISIVLMCFYFFSFAALGIIFPYLPYYLKEVGFTGTQIGIILSIVPINKLILTRYWTRLFEKISNKKIFIITLISLSNISLLFIHYFNTSFFLVSLGVFLYSFFRVGILPIIESITMEHITEYKKISYGQIRLFGSIGFILAVLSTGKMFDLIGLNYFIIFTIIVSTIVILPVMKIPFYKFSKNTENSAKLKINFEFYIIILAVTLYFISFTFNNNFLNIKISQVGLPQFTAGLMWTIGVLFEIFIMFFYGRFMKLASSKFWLSISIFAGTMRVFLIGISDNIYVLYFANFLHGMAFGLFHLAMMYYINENISEELRLKAQSMYVAFAFGLGTILGSILSGITYDYFGVNTTFLVASVFAFTSFIILLIPVKSFRLLRKN